jgi:hypothetical protein
MRLSTLLGHIFFDFHIKRADEEIMDKMATFPAEADSFNYPPQNF